jgi:ComF family protein
MEKEGVDFITNTPRMKNSVKFYGYNQSEALAKLISSYSKIPYAKSLTASKSYKTEQKTLNKTRRGQNVKNKFTAQKNIRGFGGRLDGKNIIIVDDVVTTGSTLSECAKSLKNVGAENIYALCAASVLS